jgi:hypothetical protein
VFFNEEVSAALTAITDKANTGLTAGLSVGEIRARLHKYLEEGMSVEAAQTTIEEEIKKRQEPSYPKDQLLMFLNKISKFVKDAKPNT